MSHVGSDIAFSSLAQYHRTDSTAQLPTKVPAPSFLHAARKLLSGPTMKPTSFAAVPVQDAPAAQAVGARQGVASSSSSSSDDDDANSQGITLQQPLTHPVAPHTALKALPRAFYQTAPAPLRSISSKEDEEEDEEEGEEGDGGEKPQPDGEAVNVKEEEEGDEEDVFPDLPQDAEDEAEEVIESGSAVGTLLTEAQVENAKERARNALGRLMAALDERFDALMRNNVYVRNGMLEQEQLKSYIKAQFFLAVIHLHATMANKVRPAIPPPLTRPRRTTRCATTCG